MIEMLIAMCDRWLGDRRLSSSSSGGDERIEHTLGTSPRSRRKHGWASTGSSRDTSESNDLTSVTATSFTVAADYDGDGVIEADPTESYG